jgi:hypothetical protein
MTRQGHSELIDNGQKQAITIIAAMTASAGKLPFATIG